MKAGWQLELEEGIPTEDIIARYQAYKGPQLSDEEVLRLHAQELETYYDPTYPANLLITDLLSAYTDVTQEALATQRPLNGVSGSLLWRFNAIRTAVIDRGFVEQIPLDMREMLGITS